MAELSSTLPLTAASVRQAYEKIREHVHRTPLLTNKTINRIASTGASDDQPAPQFNIYFKCENYQRIGAFKARGAFHAVTHLIEEMGLDAVKERGLITHSSGNHAQALALAASTFDIPAHIVMPSISTPSKIEGTRAYTDKVYFSGSTSQEREAKVQEIIVQTDAILVPPYDHPDIMLGQGTAALELHEQYAAQKAEQGLAGSKLKAVLTPLGGGGLLSGTTIYFSDQPETFVFGCEPSFQGGNDGEKGLKSDPPKRIESVKTLTIADGLRTTVGLLPWKAFTGGSEVKSPYLQGIYSVTEDQIKDAMRLVLERMKVFIEPSSAVPLAVVLYNDNFRRWAAEQQRAEGSDEPWDIAIVLSGGNTTIDAILGIFKDSADAGQVDRAEGIIGKDRKSVAENVAG